MTRIFEYATHAIQKADEMAKRLCKPYAILTHNRGYAVMQADKVTEPDKVLEICRPSRNHSSQRE